jgi:hypothetical protein
MTYVVALGASPMKRERTKRERTKRERTKRERTKREHTKRERDNERTITTTTFSNQIIKNIRFVIINFKRIQKCPVFF